MASNNGDIQPQVYQQQFKCDECSLTLNSAESLNVHCKYQHQGNSGQQWTGENKDGAVNQQRGPVKREFPSNMQQQADSLDLPKSSPNYQRTTPDAGYAQPPTPQSYQSSNSPFQNAEATPVFSIFPNYPYFKRENISPSHQQNQMYQHFSNFPEHHFDAGAVEPSVYPEDPMMRTFSNEPLPEMCRELMRGKEQYSEPPKQAGGALAENVSFSTQPTPSPSPKQCEKCRFVCPNTSVLMEHMSSVHQVPLGHFASGSQLMFEQQAMVKEDESASSAILDLDSQKVVHPGWSSGRKRTFEDSNITHANNTMLWPAMQPNNVFNGERMFVPTSAPTASNNNEKLYTTLTKFSPNQMDGSYLNNGVSSSNPDVGSLNQQQQQHMMSNRSFEQQAPVNLPVITTSQILSAASTAAPPSTKSSNWKSNEARRPKTYNCTACNKWFTSSGHLKRHYNTTLHKNAVKSSGHPDPATMPISAHHHPAREATSSKDGRQSNSPRDDESNSSQYGGRTNNMPALLQHTTNDLYERPGLNQHHLGNGNGAVGGQMAPNFSTNLPNGSPPNGTAGLSMPETRGLMPMAPAQGFSMISQPHMIPMDGPQYQLYPNEFAPHVTQAMDTTTLNNLNTNGEQVQYLVNVENNQPLPSFAQIQAHIGGGYANVGGLGSVMTSISYLPNQNEGQFGTTLYDLNRLVITEQPQPQLAMEAMQFSAIPNNNNDTSFADMSAGAIDANMTAVAPDAAGGAASLQEPQIMAAADESKENESENAAAETGNSNVSSSTTENQEDLSKTKCFDCDKVFNRPCYLTQHNKTCHNGDKPFKCSRCGKRYATEDVFLRHEGKHAGNKPHKCLMCPKMFNHKTDLRRHICCHTGKKPYACTICDKGFIRKDHMVKHVDTHLKKREKQSAMRS
ncbi:uncharacterized protein LOC109538706 [Dendroctonus ponderosae]|uniref:uncharacterized protein LOC109538706 n=1 Tax=Dendroctonus ponderosae TaxID=77166 RepID=UPI002035D796|nr:uncharacterized protein LOC109538706 [Dendroctonus ponderosae]